MSIRPRTAAAVGALAGVTVGTVAGILFVTLGSRAWPNPPKKAEALAVAERDPFDFLRSPVGYRDAQWFERARKSIPYRSIGISRRGCFGPCPIYSVKFDFDGTGSSGTATYEGERFVDRVGTFFGYAGIPDLAQLSLMVETSGFWTLQDRVLGSGNRPGNRDYLRRHSHGPGQTGHRLWRLRATRALAARARHRRTSGPHALAPGKRRLHSREPSEMSSKMS